MKWLSTFVMAALLAVGVPSVASAQGWRGSPRGGHGSYVAPRGHVAPGFHAGPRFGVRVAPRVVARPVAPARVWVPGYWGNRGDARIWIGGAWALPPQAGWAWVAPHWTWNGYSWVWQQGYWAPPTY